MKHKNYVPFYTDLQSLAEEIGNLRYDSLAELFDELSIKLAKDAANDRSKGKEKLAKILDDLSDKFKKAENDAEDAWKICKPFMEKQEA